MNNKKFRFIFQSWPYVMLASAMSQSKRDKDYKANVTFEAGEYDDAIDLYKTAYNKIKDRNKKNEIVFKIAECYRITREPRKPKYGIKRPLVWITRIPWYFFIMARCS